MKTGKRTLAFLLCLMMLFSLLPASALAAENGSDGGALAEAGGAQEAEDGDGLLGTPPLRVIDLGNVDLTGYFDQDLAEYPFQALLDEALENSGQEIIGTPKVYQMERYDEDGYNAGVNYIWSGQDDQYEPIVENMKLDLSFPEWALNSDIDDFSRSVELITRNAEGEGDADQFDENNVIYRFTFTVSNPIYDDSKAWRMLDLEGTRAAAKERTALDIYRMATNTISIDTGEVDDYGGPIMRTVPWAVYDTDGDTYGGADPYLSIGIVSEHYTLDAYEGLLLTEEDLSGATKIALTETESFPEAGGYSADFSQADDALDNTVVTLAFKDGDRVVHMLPLFLTVNPVKKGLVFDKYSFRKEDSTTGRSESLGDWAELASGESEHIFRLSGDAFSENIRADSPLYFRLAYMDPEEYYGNNRAIGSYPYNYGANYIKYAVQGTYTTAEALEEAYQADSSIDIKSSLFNSSGYSKAQGSGTNYSGGVDFTVALKDMETGEIAEVLNFTVSTVDDWDGTVVPTLRWEPREGSRQALRYGATYVDNNNPLTPWQYRYYFGDRDAISEQEEPMMHWYVLPDGNLANETYYLSLAIPGWMGVEATKVRAVYDGYFAADQEIPAGTPNIANQIFASSASLGGGYGADFSDGKTFTMVDYDGNRFYYALKTVSVWDNDFDSSLFVRNDAGEPADITNNAVWGVTYPDEEKNPQGEEAIELHVVNLRAGYSADTPYYLSLQIGNWGHNSASRVAKAVEGYYEGAIPSNAADIKDKLFETPVPGDRDHKDGGYTTDFSKAKTFTIQDLGGNLHYYRVQIVAREFLGSFSVDLYKGDEVTGERTPAYGDAYDDDIRHENYDAANKLDSIIITVSYNYDAYDYFYLNLSIPNWGNNGLARVKTAVVGDYATEAEIAASGKEDISGRLFTSASVRGGGYGGRFNQAVTFTVVDVDGAVWHVRVRTVSARANRPLSSDTYFNITSVERPDDSELEGTLRYFVMPYGDDSYYYYGYQTVFVMNEVTDEETGETSYEPVTDGQLIPVSPGTSDVTRLYHGHQGSAGDPLTLGDPVDVEQYNGTEPIQISAASESGELLKNYWLTFLTPQEGGPKLFVNGTNDTYNVDSDTGLPVRRMFLTDSYESYHDIYFANIGDEPMTGLKVELSSDVKGVELDNYWRVLNDGNQTLPAFDKIESDYSYRENEETGEWDDYYGQLPNVAKVRLHPTGDDGEISGRLRISYDGLEQPYEIVLSGAVGDLQILTVSDALRDGVKYVPYQQLIRTNSMMAADAVAFKIIPNDPDAQSPEEEIDYIEGMPNGVEVLRSGEVYGVPLETGDYRFTVSAGYSVQIGGMAEADTLTTDVREFTVRFKENTDSNVWAENSAEYGHEIDTNASSVDRSKLDPDMKNALILPRVSSGTVRSGTWYILHSGGKYGYVTKVFLNGAQLEDDDYITIDGSTILVTEGSTLQDKAGEGNVENTLAIEFRDPTAPAGTENMSVSAQNFKLDVSPITPPGPVPAPGPGPTPTSDTGGSSDRTTDVTPSTPSAPPAPAGIVLLNVPVTTSNGTAVMGVVPQAELDSLTAYSGVTGVAIDLTASGLVSSARVPAAALQALANAVNNSSNNIETAELRFSDAVLNLDGNVLSALLTQAVGSEVSMDAKPITADDLSQAQLSALGERTIFNGIRLSFASGGNEINSLQGGRLAVEIPFSSIGNGTDFSVFYVSDERAARHATSFKDNKVGFRIAHFSDFIIASDSPVNYSDVITSDWYADVVSYVTRSKIMVGDGYGGFAPSAKVTRAMLAQILYNMENTPDGALGSQFVDVADSDWYADAIAWAAEAKVISGVGNNRFDPLAEITREQAAQMLFNYAAYKNYSMSNSKPLTSFADAGTVSEWAEEALQWAVGEKLISGRGNKTLAPQDTASRAEIAKILAYFCESYEQ